MPTCEESLAELRDEISIASEDQAYVLYQRYVGIYFNCHFNKGSFDPDDVVSATPDYLPKVALEILDSVGSVQPGVSLPHTEEQLRAQILAYEYVCEPAVSSNVETGADPVTLHSGEFVYRQTDLKLQGAGLDFAFIRTYRNQTPFNGNMGHRWSHNLHVFLRQATDTLFVLTGFLAEEPFTRHPRFGESPDFSYFLPPDGRDAVIFEDGDSFRLRTPSGFLQRFERHPTMTFLHRLKRLEDRFGNYHELRYVDESLVEVEVNHPTRLVRFEYDGHDRICSVVDFTGRRWGYSYDSAGDLVRVTSPKPVPLRCESTTTFEYSSAEQTAEARHNLLRIIDSEGNLYLENDYGAGIGLPTFNRVTRQRLANGQVELEYEDIIEDFAFDYGPELRPATRTIVREANGHIVDHVFNAFGNLLRREEQVLENGQLRCLTQHYRYDRGGRVVASLSPEGALQMTLRGREVFLRTHGLAPTDELPVASLTWRDRQSFGRIITMVSRATLARLADIQSNTGEWGHLGDIFSRVHDPDGEDIIWKYSYEPDYGQLLTVSDPRFTIDPAPNSLVEHPEHQDTLTTHSYDGPPGDPNLFLVEIRRPTPTLPDGAVGAPVLDSFRHADGTPGYDPRGRLLRHVDSIGTIHRRVYFTGGPLDPRDGFLETQIADEASLAITTSFETDALGRVIKVTLPRGTAAGDDRFRVTHEYDALDRLVSTTSSPPFLIRHVFDYDGNGNLIREERGTADGSVTPAADRQVRTFCYNAMFNITESTRGGVTGPTLRTRFCYDASGDPIVKVRPRGNRIRYEYDERRLFVAQASGAESKNESEIRVRYDGDGRGVEIRSGRGHATLRQHDTFDRVVFETDPLGHVKLWTYDKLGNVTHRRSFDKRPAGYYLLERVDAAFDELGRPVSTTEHEFEDAPGPVPEFLLGSAFLSGPIPNADPRENQYFLDPAGRIVRQVDAAGHSVSSSIDALGRVAEVEDSLGNVSSYQYDSHGNLLREDRIEKVRDPNNPGTITGQRVFSRTSSYDEFDRLISTTDGLGNVERYSYDYRDNLISRIDPLGNAIETDFDILDRPVSISHPMTATGLGGGALDSIDRIRMLYDVNGNIVAITDANGNTVTYGYDDLDRLVSITYPDSSETRYSYDADHNVVESVDNNGLVRRYTVDASGQNTHTAIDGSAVFGTTVEGATFERFAYDANGNRTLEENDFCVCVNDFNSLGLAIRETVRFVGAKAPIKTPLVLRREHDAIGRVTRLIYPSGRTIAYTRDALGRITGVANQVKGTPYPGFAGRPDAYEIAILEYVGEDLRRIVNENDTVTTLTYDRTSKPIDVEHESSNLPMLRLQYLHDAAENVRVKAEFSPLGDSSTGYRYDSRYRFVDATARVDTPFDTTPVEPPDLADSGAIPSTQFIVDGLIGSLELPAGVKDYHYDPAGNRVTSGGGNQSYVTNSLNQYVTINDSTSGGTIVLSYDKNGNLIRHGNLEYRYDSNDRLVRVVVAGATICEFLHDVRGRRVLEVIPTGTTQLLYDSAALISEYHDGALKIQCVHGDALDRPFQLAVDGDEYWFHADLIGSIRRLSDRTGQVSARYDYDEFGQQLASTTPTAPYNPLRFTGQRFDSTIDQYDFRSRQYAPLLGRFLQRDPRRSQDGENLYTYVGNNPLSFADPLGTEREKATPEAIEKMKRTFLVRGQEENEEDDYAFLKREARGHWRRKAVRHFSNIIDGDFPYFHPTTAGKWFGSEVVATFEAPLDAPYTIAKSTERAAQHAAQATFEKTLEGKIEQISLSVGGFIESFLQLASYAPMTPGPVNSSMPKARAARGVRPKMKKTPVPPPARTSNVAVDMQNIADYLHGAMKPRGQRGNTVAVGIVDLGDDNLVLVYSVSGNRNPKELRAAAERAGVTRAFPDLPKGINRTTGGTWGGRHHAEQLLEEWAVQAGGEVKHVRASRTYCADCSVALPPEVIHPVRPASGK